MPDLADLYPGFASHWIDTSADEIFARVGGGGPPLLLLHGYPQTNVMWHSVAPMLAQHFTLVIADLPGYGWSAAPRAQADHAPYTKRAMAAAMVEVMEALGFARFRLAGHDRGGRVAIGSRSIIRAGSTSSRCSTSCRPRPCGIAWTRGSPRASGTGCSWRCRRRFPRRDRPRSEVLLRLPRRAGTKAQERRRPSIRARSRITTPPMTTRSASTRPARITAPAAPPISPHDEADRAAGKKIGCPMLALWGSSGLPANAGSTRSRAGANGRPMCAASPSTAGIIWRRRIRTATAQALLEFFGAG